MSQLEPMPEDWARGLAIVAHPDDMEYGAAAAVARWAAHGKRIGYVLVSDGEVGIKTMSPQQAGPIRQGERRAGCAVVGVTEVEFLGHPDGAIVEGLALRGVRDAANPWMFAEAGEPWDGVRFVAFSGSPQPTHFVDIGETFDAGVRSLEAHRVYLENLGGEMGSPSQILRDAASTAGAEAGVALATTFEVIG